jgi:hypothetical protein
MFYHSHLNGLNVSTAMVYQCLFQSWEKGKNRKVTKCGEYGACRHTVI